MSKNFYDKPIINTPYKEPNCHYEFDDKGEPLDGPPVSNRRESKYYTPVPKPRKKKSQDNQPVMPMHPADGISTEDQEYSPTPIINEIRSHVAEWRVKKESDWEVTPPTARLLNHWREHEFIGIRPFFCQIEAVETIIWLTEVAPKHAKYKPILDHIKNANASANPDLIRLAMKMATGAGKTTVMAMLIAWHVANAVNSPNSKKYSRGFLIVTPGITIRDRLRVLLPSDPDNYYQKHDLVPYDMKTDIQKAKIVITNYHAFQRRDTMNLNATSRALLRGRGAPLKTEETDGQMVDRVAKDLQGIKNICVINDEAHHCYQEKGDDNLSDLKGDEKKDAEKENKAARVWINGLRAFKTILNFGAIYDLSATPFFLSGSGWPEGTLFPWVVSDFSLIDAIECGIVKLPRVPVADDTLGGKDSPIFRNLWENISKDMPKKGGQTLDPHALPQVLQNAMHQMYKHYVETKKKWDEAGTATPPVFIVVCNNTSTSKLVFDYIAGWTATKDGKQQMAHAGHMPLFSNFKDGELRDRPNTLLIDSRQIESGEIDDKFRKMMSAEIDKFKRDRTIRTGDASDVTDSELLREVMNTVGKEGKLGAEIRCVVSVSMLTEGWDANTVTHILGIRAFGTQLLCEQVVGRALRRLSYDLNDEEMYNPEYADIIGIPFDFASKPQIATVHPPKQSTHIRAVTERANAEITFPRITSYCVDLLGDRLRATFTEQSKYTITPDIVGSTETDLEGIVGKPSKLVAGVSEKRLNTIVMELAKRLIEDHFRDSDNLPRWVLFWDAKRICQNWLEQGYLICKGGTNPSMLEIPGLAGQALERIHNAISKEMAVREDDAKVRAVLDPYNPKGSTRYVNFATTKDTYRTGDKCHLNYTVMDSEWEGEFARVVEDHPRVLSYVKNQNLGFEIPYRDGTKSRKYIPDFIVKLDDGRGVDDPLYLIVETKGFPDDKEGLKSGTLESQWLPGVNDLGDYGRWDFAIFKDGYDIKKEFTALIDKKINDNTQPKKES